MRRWFGAFLILSLASCGEKLGHEVDLSQLEWTVACQSERVQPCSAEVPGHVLPSLVNAGLAPNPDHGTHERDVQWVEDETWTYSTKLPPTHMAGMDSAVLTFQGLDTYARVLVGDQWVLSAENAHRSWTSLPFACSDDSLTLAITFDPVAQRGKAAFGQSWPCGSCKQRGQTAGATNQSYDTQARLSVWLGLGATTRWARHLRKGAFEALAH